MADLPTFAGNNDNKQNIVQELMQENGVENTEEGIKANDPGQKPATNINVDGETKPVEPSKGKKKSCGC